MMDTTSAPEKRRDLQSLAVVKSRARDAVKVVVVKLVQASLTTLAGKHMATGVVTSSPFESQFLVQALIRK